jgi:LPS-assembly protein
MRLFNLLIFLTISIYASDKFELLASKVHTKDGITQALGNVVVQGSNYYFQANRATYNKNSEVLELFDNVNIVKNGFFYTVSNYAKIDLKNDAKILEPMFLLDDKSGVWINSKSAKTNKDDYYLGQSTLSSCDTKDPFWSISFQEGEYNQKEQWINLYHSTFYFKDLPTFYLPYFGFPTDQTRRSGLLVPKISLNRNEGFSFIQPIYFAPDQNWDLEILPQIRTTRGQGLYTTLRFEPNKYSSGFITTGFFRDTDDWQKEHSLKNQVHNGIKAEYTNKKLLSDNNDKDGLYISISRYNDVDFLNLEGINTTSNTNPIATSKVNYFYNKDDYYMGLYSRYNYDTSKDSNSQTIQTLPQLQFHKVTNNVFTNKLLYSFDFKATRYNRNEKVNADQLEFLVPISYSESFFNDYITLSISENFYTSLIDYSNDNNFNDARYVNNYHKLGINSMLLSKYSNFLHSIDLNADYIIPSYESKRGDIYLVTNNNEDLDFIVFDEYRRSLNLSITQFLNDFDLNEILYHRVSQTIFYDTYEYKYANLLNEVAFNISKNLNFYHKNEYSHENSNIEKMSSTVSFDSKDGLTLKFNNTYEDSEDEFNNYFSFGFNKKIDFQYSIHGNSYYNQHTKEITKFNFGYSMKKSCWEYKVDYIKDTTPILTNSGTQTVKNDKIYFEIELKPLGMGLSQYIEDI